MPEYQEILDTEVEPEAPLTSSLGVRFRDNPIALANGASGAPRIQTAALNNSAVTTAKINNGAVTTAKINNGAVTRAKLKMGINSVSGDLSSGTSTVINLNDYSLFPSTSGSRYAMRLDSNTGANAENPKFLIGGSDADAGSYAAAWRFIET